MIRSLTLTSVGLSLLAATTVLSPAYTAPPPNPAPEKRNPGLFMAIGHQDAAAVKAMLARGADPNAQNTLGMSALTIAAGVGNLEVIQALLAAGAEVNGGSQFGGPLTFAAYDSKPEVMRLLLEKGASISTARPDRISILMLAARAGHPEVLRQVLAKKADLHAVDNHGSTALSYAARAGKAEAARILLEAGAKVDAADVDGWTPLMHAAVNGHDEVAALLLKKGANLKAKDKMARTALLVAASYGDHPEVVRLLVAGGAPIEAKDGKGRTARALAEGRGYVETARILSEKGARAIPASKTPLRTPRQAAELGLRQVEKSMQVFAKRTGCVSCHHEGIARFATGFAQARGYAIDRVFNKAQEQRVLQAYEEMRPLLQKAAADPSQTGNVPIVDVGDLAPTTGTLLLGLAEHQTPASETLGDAVMVLARTQTPDGDWRFGFVREPVQSSFFSATAMTIRALKTYAPKQHSAEVEQRIGRAKQWLLTASVKSTEDRVFRLLGLKWAGATPEERRKATDELRATQRPDGGWAQFEPLKSDAYATGSALFALNQGGDLPAADPVYQKGAQYLLRTQEDDGTWYVYKRAIPANNYFNSEFPYGQSQYISHAAACWATLALILADETSAAPSRAAR
jgi:ankyrin repeat protein